MKKIDSFIGTCKDIRLSVHEKQAIRASVFHEATTPSLAVIPTGHLFAYEKALMLNALSDIVQDSHAPSPAELKFTIWHGNLFNHLQPFVLKTTRD